MEKPRSQYSLLSISQSNAEVWPALALSALPTYSDLLLRIDTLESEHLRLIFATSCLSCSTSGKLRNVL